MKSPQSSSMLNKPKNEKKRRRYHLGLDWGTSATKLVLRDYEQGKAFVVIPTGLESSYRYPATCVIEKKRVYFGVEAEKRKTPASKVFDALKADIYEFENVANNESIVSKEDLATLSLAHIISIGLDFADKHAAQSDSTALMGMTLGVPAEELEKSELRHIYLKMARTAYEIAVRMGCDPQGAKYLDCLQLLVTAREEIVKKDAKNKPDPNEYAQWLRPELAAAMYWGVKSPTIQSDLYSCVDIGAWTTNASYFRIHHANGDSKGGISFYGGACRTPGILKLLGDIATILGQHPTSLFGHEDRYLKYKKYKKYLDAYREEYFTIWKEGFQRAYIKEKSQGVWDGKLNVMVVGGGSKSLIIKNTFEEKFPNKGWAPAKPVPDLGVPSDLFDFPAVGTIPINEFTGDHTFLLVAYGLSVHSKDFPKTTLALQVDPFQPNMRVKKSFKNYEDLGFEK